MSDTRTWGHMLERAKNNSFLGKELFVVFTYPANGMDPIMENITEHLAYQRMLEDTGVMFAAGRPDARVRRAQLPCAAMAGE